MAKSKKRKKAATPKKIKVKSEDKAVPEETAPAAQAAPVRYLLLTTDGINVFITQRTMSIPEAKNAVTEALQTFQLWQQQALQVAQQQASQAGPPAEQPPADEPAPEEPAPPAEEVAEKPSGEASALHLAKPN